LLRFARNDIFGVADLLKKLIGPDTDLVLSAPALLSDLRIPQTYRHPEKRSTEFQRAEQVES
jgi:hypothetical protein